MKHTKIIKLVLLSGVLIILYACPNMGECIWYCNNSSSDTLGIYLAFGYVSAYPDTTLPADFNKANIMGAPPHKKQSIYRGIDYDKMIKDLPKDTLSVFFIHQDTLLKYRWEEIRQGYKILKRYDLSLYDMHHLSEDHSPVIPYPPTAAMKNMKMYPPYGQ